MQSMIRNITLSNQLFECKANKSSGQSVKRQGSNRNDRGGGSFGIGLCRKSLNIFRLETAQYDGINRRLPSGGDMPRYFCHHVKLMVSFRHFPDTRLSYRAFYDRRIIKQYAGLLLRIVLRHIFDI